jgi:hypothetical protein
MVQRATDRPFRRRVFYIPGFDPFPARRYREIYRTEGARQAALSGYDLAFMPRAEGAPGYGWAVETRTGGTAAQADVEVLIWDDIVQARMRPGLIGIYWTMLHTIWVYFSTGATWGLIRVRIGPFIAGFYPVTVLVVQLGLAVAAGWAVWLIAGWAGGGHPLALLAGALGGALAGWAVLAAGRRLDGRLFARYLMFELAQSAIHRGGYGADLQSRLDDFAARVARARTGDWDEVLVVGHSSGAALAVTVVAQSLKLAALKAGPGGAPLALLTLGQVIPLHSFLPRARGLRRDLHDLSLSDGLTWIDVSAPGDGGSFGLADPVAISGVRPEGARWPRILSAAFRQTLAPETFRRLRWRFYALHFQYLRAFERAGDYDYFQITAGARTLADRFAGRRDSPQTIRRVFSPHRDMA